MFYEGREKTGVVDQDVGGVGDEFCGWEGVSSYFNLFGGGHDGVVLFRICFCNTTGPILKSTIVFLRCMISILH